MVEYNLQWLRARTSRILNFNSGQTNQDFAGTSDDPNLLIDEALNEAYQIELTEAINDTDPDHFIEYESFTWASGARTLVLPSHIQDSEILYFTDITNFEPGDLLWVATGGSGHEAEISFLGRHTLQWGSSGPGSTMTVRVVYMPSANHMQDPADEPRYIPEKYRWILPWTAAIILRSQADEAAPQEWVRQRDDWRQRFHVAMSQGRATLTNKARILPLTTLAGS